MDAYHSHTARARDRILWVPTETVLLQAKVSFKYESKIIPLKDIIKRRKLNPQLIEGKIIKIRAEINQIESKTNQKRKETHETKS